MTTNIQPGSGGGIHPGSPIIWPTAKKIQQTQSSTEIVQASKNTKAQAAPTSSTDAATTAAAAKQAAAVPEMPPARPMSMQDIVQQLFSLGIPNSGDNKFLASLMLEHGIELSPENFENLFRMLKGKNSKSVFESAVIALSKNLRNSASVNMLNNFFSADTEALKQLQVLQQALSNFHSAMMSGKNTLDPGLLAGLTQLVSSFDSELKKLTKEGLNPTDFIKKRGTLIRSLKGFLQLLTGLESKLAALGKLNTPEGRELQRQILFLRKELENVLGNLTSQAILSKDGALSSASGLDKYLYWLVPNIFDQNTNIELLIKKDPSEKEAKIDPEKTKIVIKIDTPELGEMVIMIDVLEKKVWYIFNTEREETKQFIDKMNKDLQDRMHALGLNLIGFQAIQRKVDIKQFLLPTLNLDDVVRISAEA